MVTEPRSTAASTESQVFSVDRRGRVRDATGETVTPGRRQDLRQALAGKVAAGRASVTERRCLSALQRGAEA